MSDASDDNPTLSNTSNGLQSTYLDLMHYPYTATGKCLQFIANYNVAGRLTRFRLNVLNYHHVLMLFLAVVIIVLCRPQSPKSLRATLAGTSATLLVHLTTNEKQRFYSRGVPLHGNVATISTYYLWRIMWTRNRHRTPQHGRTSRP